MQFALMIYHGTYPLPGTPEFEETFSKEEQKTIYADFAAFNKVENVTSGPPLGLAKNATTVRVDNGSAVATEGPYVDIKGAVAGFAVVEAEDLEAAVAIASRIPQARHGGAVEVRPSEKYW